MRNYTTNRYRNSKKDIYKPQKYNLEEWLFKNSLFIILSIIPILAYGIAYSYEIGYASAWRIPLSFIKVDVLTVVPIAGFMMISLLILLVLASLFFMIRNPLILKLRYYGIAIISFYLIFYAITSIYIINKLHVTVSIIPTILLFLIVFLLFVFLVYISLSEKDKLKKIFYMSIATLFIPVIMMCSAIYIGNTSGKTQTSYWGYTENNKLIVVLRIYDDILIAAPLDSSSKPIKSSIIIKKLNDNPVKLERLKLVTR